MKILVSAVRRVGYEGASDNQVRKGVNSVSVKLSFLKNGCDCS